LQVMATSPVTGTHTAEQAAEVVITGSGFPRVRGWVSKRLGCMLSSIAIAGDGHFPGDGDSYC
jgi:hypothetical protein